MFLKGLFHGKKEGLSLILLITFTLVKQVVKEVVQGLLLLLPVLFDR